MSAPAPNPAPKAARALKLGLDGRLAAGGLLKWLLPAVGFLALTPALQGVQAEIALAREEVAQLGGELEGLRARAAEVPAVEGQVAALEKALEPYARLPEPAPTGAARLSARLRAHGWEVGSAAVGPTTEEAGVRRTAVTVQFRCGYADLVAGLRSLRHEAAVPQALQVRLEADGRLSGSATVQLLKVGAP